MAGTRVEFMVQFVVLVENAIQKNLEAGSAAGTGNQQKLKKIEKPGLDSGWDPRRLVPEKKTIMTDCFPRPSSLRLSRALSRNNFKGCLGRFFAFWGIGLRHITFRFVVC